MSLESSVIEALKKKKEVEVHQMTKQGRCTQYSFLVPLSCACIFWLVHPHMNTFE